MNLEAVADGLNTEKGMRWLWAGVWILFALAMGACVAKGADSPADPALQDASRVAGFAEVSIRIDPAEAEATERCALLADTARTRSQGLIGRSDLGGYDAMVFVFQEDVRAGFHMRNVPIPLSIAFFDRSGRFVSARDMTPCLNQADCPIYGAEKDFRYAIEAKQGDLGRLGISPGSTLAVGGSCSG